jgi:hypothetical protein
MPDDLILNLWKKNLDSVPETVWDHTDRTSLILAADGKRWE